MSLLVLLYLKPLLYALLSAQLFLNTHLFLSARTSLPPSPTPPPDSFLGAPCYILEYSMTWLAGFLVIMLNARYIPCKEWVPVLFVYNAMHGGAWVMFASRPGRVCVDSAGVKWEVGLL